MDYIIILCNSHSKYVRDKLVINCAYYELDHNEMILAHWVKEETYIIEAQSVVYIELFPLEAS